MDDTRNEKLFRILQEDCEWKIDEPLCNRCAATKMFCRLKYCVPFKFALFFNRPEIQEG
jgi:hypothetical protein